MSYQVFILKNCSINPSLGKVVHLCVGKSVNIHVKVIANMKMFSCVYGLFDGYVCHVAKNIH